MEMWTKCNKLHLKIGKENFHKSNILEFLMHQMVMSSDNARAVAMTCDRCQSKMQSVAELLLISCEARPVSSEDLLPFIKSQSRCREEILDILQRLGNLMKDVASQVTALSVHWHSMCHTIQEMSELVVRLAECSSHSAYLIAINFPNCQPSKQGIVDRYQVARANLDIKISCTRLKRSRNEDLNPQFLVDICSSISKALSIMSDICKYAGENTSAATDHEQFKLCIKSVTSSTSCLITSIRSFKSRPTSSHFGRILAFCDPVISASSALVTFATEDGFIGKPADLTPDAKETQKAILGACMSIVSANVQMCRSLRDLSYDVMNPRHRERITQCTESMVRASSQLQDLLTSCTMDDESDTQSTSSTVSSTTSR